MEILGFDTVVFTFRDPRTLASRIACEFRRFWPDGIQEVGLDASAKTTQVTDASLDEVAKADASICLYFARDSAMWKHFNEHSFQPFDRGEATVAILLRRRPTLLARLASVTECIDIGVPRPDIRPYDAWIASPSLVEVTCITHAGPMQDPFARTVLAMVMGACR